MKMKMKLHCIYLKKHDYSLFKNRSKQYAFVLNPLKTMSNLEMYRLNLHQLEYEMDHADLPDD